MKLNCIKDVLQKKDISQMWLSKKLDKSFSTVNAYACNRL
jgi:putative transcriptional regulator